MKTKDVYIESAAQAAAIIRAELPKEQKEERVFVLPLDANGKMLAKPILVSVGHQDGTAAIDAGAIFREALKAGAEEIIVAHNHPSGDLTPSKADVVATEKLREAGDLLGVPLLDHIILGVSDSSKGLRIQRFQLWGSACSLLSSPSFFCLTQRRGERRGLVAMQAAPFPP